MVKIVSNKLAVKDDPIFTGRMTISSHSNPETNAPDWTLETANSESWHFKVMENMQMHLAYWNIKNGETIFFTNTMGDVFDEVTCSDSKSVENFLFENGFGRCFEDKEFMRLFDHPLQIEKHQYLQKSVYSA